MINGCGGGASVRTQNFAHLYSDGGNLLQPKFKVFHKSLDSTDIYFSFDAKGLLYNKTEDSGDDFVASFRIGYQLFSDYDMKVLLDSGSVVFEDQMTKPSNKLITGKLGIEIHREMASKKPLLVLFVSDLNRKTSIPKFVNLSLKDSQSAENFLWTDTAGNVNFGNQFQLNTPFLLHYNLKGTLKYRVRYYNRNFSLALPPHVNKPGETLSYQADSIFDVDATKPIILSNPGFYHFQVFETSKSGFTLFHFDEYFPLISKKNQLSGPLRYLTNNEEYAEISFHEDPDSIKYYVDKFWLTRAGSVERAQKLVNTYYQRIERSNELFTSYLEGWKSDRGLIYVIFGAPSTIYRDELTERWIYGEANSSLSYNFTFVRVNNPFTNNDYALTRLSSFRYGWGQAIETWRNGQVYGVRDIKKEQDDRDQQLRMQQSPYFWY
ncbi:MAG: GWxTD domain-containing protein [Schleiferiaceae bacterium]|nr:GWxTD domain-containing protein [Schleiferiaceae bacterium]